MATPTKNLQIIGKKKSGKTTTTVDFIKAARELNLTVATFKHTHHTVSMDVEGTDTDKFAKAGAQQVGMQNDTGFFWHESRDNGVNVSLQEEIDYFVRPETDLLLIEGFKNEKFSKLVLLREKDRVEDFEIYDKIDFIATMHKEVLAQFPHLIDLTTEEKRKEWLKEWYKMN